jgi:LysR family transcriptional regulator, benzoate and cis,cis-muconate-responsive activator of ben and cat genes
MIYRPEIAFRNDFEVSMLVTSRYQSRGMELRHLRYFVAVGEELNFRKASDRLHISRPALSKQIKDLEDEIAVRLLDRDTVSVSLTKAGEIFLDDARKILHHAENAVARANEAQSGHRGKLRIGSVGIIATDFLPKTLKIFHQEFPGVEVVFVEMLPAEQLAALADGRIDIGFAYGKEIESMTCLRSLCVIHSTYGVALSRQHPLADRKSLAIAEVAGETLLCLGGESRATHREALASIYYQDGSRPGKVRQVDGFDTLVTLIAADQGVSLLPLVLDLDKQDIVIIPIAVTAADLDFHMWAVWKRHLPSHHIKHFIQLLEQRVMVQEVAV